MRIIEIEHDKLLFKFSPTGTFYMARVLETHPDHIRVQVEASFSGEGSFRGWGEKRDGVINILPPSSPDVEYTKFEK